MRHNVPIIVLVFLSFTVFGQNPGGRKFSKTALEEDLQFIKDELFHAHANPFSELDSLAYEDLFSGVQQGLRDSMTAFEFAKRTKPLFAPLSDEHAKLSVSLENSGLTDAAILLPFSIREQGDVVVIDSVLAENMNLRSGDTLRAIEGLPIRDIIRGCAAFTTGFPEQRLAKASAQFGLLYLFAYPNRSEYSITLQHRRIRVAGVPFKTWDDFSSGKNKRNTCNELLSYQRRGKVGYLDFCSFNIRSDSAYHQLELKMEALFRQIRRDRIDTLIIDVSKNSGGNSQCGNLMIDYIYAQPYQSYQCKWKRSDEYLSLMAQWKSTNEAYQNTPVGGVLALGPYTNTPAPKLKNRFAGKVYVVIGAGTFSSAIMFATLIKDNRIATLIGQEPANGHPNHFGEMYGSTTPNAKLAIQFGVKAWIRPSGNLQENRLIPDIGVDLDRIGSWEELMPAIRG